MPLSTPSPLSLFYALLLLSVHIMITFITRRPSFDIGYQHVSPTTIVTHNRRPVEDWWKTCEKLKIVNILLEVALRCPAICLKVFSVSSILSLHVCLIRCWCTIDKHLADCCNHFMVSQENSCPQQFRAGCQSTELCITWLALFIYQHSCTYWTVTNDCLCLPTSALHFPGAMQLATI